MDLSVKDPIALFQLWLGEAVGAGLREPTAAALGTCDRDGQPTVRMVLLKHVDAAGFVFATNYESRKARDLEANPRAALTFWWDALERQVRVCGRTTRAAEADSDAIFAARPRAAQIGAWASPQSRPIADRAGLERRVEQFEQRWPDAVPRPPFWGAFRLSPESVEFWQGRPHRLHDRLLCSRREGGWHVERLAP
jgi:pyridoxamine 5'-phosphate oxidase